MAEKTLKVKYVGDEASLKRTVAGIDRMHASLGSKVRGIGTTVARGLGTAAKASGVALLAIGGFALKAAAEAQTVGAQTRAAIESTGGAAGVTAKQVDALATSIQGYSGISDEAVASGANMLLTFTNIKNAAGEGNDIFDQSTKVLADMSTALGTDMKTSAIGLGKALNDPVRGVTALRRVGVSFTEAQEKQIAAMVKAGDTMGAQKLILGELTTEFGGSAKAIGSTFTGQLNIAKETVGNALESIGGTLITKLGPILPTITNAIMSLVNIVGPVLGQLLGVVAKTIGELLPILAPVVRVLGTQLAGVVRQLAPLLKQLLPPLAQLVKAILPLVPLGIRLILLVLKPLIPVINFVITRALVPLVNAFVDVVRFIVGKVQPTLKVMAGVFRSVFGGIKDFVLGVWDAIWGGIRTVINFVIGGLQTLINAGIRAYNFVANLPFNPMDPVAAVTLPRLAHGTRSFAGGAAVLGERGPEIAALPRGTRVFDAAQTRDMMGGGVVVNITVQGSVVSEAELVETVRRGLVRLGRRNGTLGNALGLA